MLVTLVIEHQRSHDDMWGAAEAPLPRTVTEHDDWSGSTTKMFTATVLVRLFFLRENYRLTAAF
jgi:hypothetical protein